MFYCAVDLKSYRKLKAETYQMPEPIELCNRFCPEQMLQWYLKHYPDVIDIHNDAIQFFFDGGEPFKDPFEAKWNQEKMIAQTRGSWSIWQRADEVSAADMRRYPGVQAADLIA